jgi:hypothetical protein
MFRLLLCSHRQADLKNKKYAYNTVTIFVGDLFLYQLLYKVYNGHHDDDYKTLAETCS